VQRDDDELMGAGDFDFTDPDQLEEALQYWEPSYAVPKQLTVPETPRPADSQLAPVPVGQTVANGKQPLKKVVREPLARLNATPVSVAKPTVPVIHCLCRAFILVIVGSHGQETQRVESKSASVRVDPDTTCCRCCLRTR